MEYAMTWKDKLEIGLKDDAPFRRDNLPEFQQTDGPENPDAERSPEEPGARAEAARESLAVKQHRGRRAPKRARRTPPAS
jgi:hypothetical protein